MTKSPTLVMIHGLIGSLRYFAPATRLPGIRIIAEDLLGYGRQARVPVEGVSLVDQAEQVAGALGAAGEAPVWLLGHSMGGAVAVLVAARHPERVAGLINVEGNFTAVDTFWSGRIATLTAEDWAAEYRVMQADPAGWLERCGVEPDAQRTQWAAEILQNQPASTVQAMARALVQETRDPGYLGTVQRLVDAGLPLHLIGGARSAGGWGVPPFVRRAAASYTEQPGVGHLPMLEDADAFCRIVESCLRGS
jgi:pimeloyl-ACP methyl ester carboxylesterase